MVDLSNYLLRVEGLLSLGLIGVADRVADSSHEDRVPTVRAGAGPG